MKRPVGPKCRHHRMSFGCEQLEVRRVLDASALALWDLLPAEASSQSLTLDEGFNVTAESPVGDFSYASSSSAVTITGYRGAGGTVVIPAVINDLPVTAIGVSAFNAKTNLTSITIPSGVKDIGDSAFRGCTNLASVSIPDTVTRIGSRAFRSCTKLATINIPSSVSTIRFQAFWDCTSLTSISIPDSITDIESATFLGCTGLTTFTIPSRVTDIGIDAFNGCASLTEITIPASVTTIGTFAFSACSSMRSINVEASNANYVSVNGVLYDKAQTLLVRCPCAWDGELSIPNSVTSIDTSALSRCSGLTKVDIPASVTRIGSRAFHGCTNLTSISIPSSVTTIESESQYGTFGLMPRLEAIYFLGTPPALDFPVFVESPVTVYRLDAATGWSTTYGDKPVKIFQVLSVPTGQTSIATIGSTVDRVVKQGAGVAVLDAPTIRTGGTIVEAGELIVRNKDTLGVGLLNVMARAKVTLQTGYDNIPLTSLIMSSTSRINIGTARLTVAASGFSEGDIRGHLLTGRYGGGWNGPNGIMSSSAGGSTNRAVGYRVNSDGVLTIAWAAFGDSNLDGQVNSTDVTLINSSGKFGQGSSTGSTWSQGDFNYSGGVTSTDITLLNSAGLFGTGSYRTQSASSGIGNTTSTSPSLDHATAFAALAIQASSPIGIKRK